MNLDLVSELLDGEPAYRARQVWAQAYMRLAASYEEMTDLPAELRQRLAAELPFPVADIDAHRVQLCDYCFYGGPAGLRPSLRCGDQVRRPTRLARRATLTARALL